jgi:predicted RNA-binding Zn-ribbon protein involved in translation (DUF1610 family)
MTKIQNDCIATTCVGKYVIIGLDYKWAIFQCDKCGKLKVMRDARE